MAKFVIIQTVVPDYRKKVFQHIKDELRDSFILYSGQYYFENSVKTDTSIKFVKKIDNYFFLDRKILIQNGMWFDSLNSDVLILEMNPRIISNWILLLTRKLIRKKTILWGHAWPRGGKDSKSDKIRNLMRTLASEVIVYTETQEKELKKKMPNKIIKSAPNAVFYKNEMQSSIIKENEILNIIFVGRLTKLKKPFLLVKAFADIINKLPLNANLIIVGNGDEKTRIIDFVNENKLKDRIYVLGHINDFTTLRELYSYSLLSVSPGYVGLSIIQSFGFGVPMLISKNENHSPEIEAAHENFNSLTFKTDNQHELGLKILSFYSDKKKWINKRSSLSQFCKNNYSVEEMANKIIETID